MTGTTAVTTPQTFQEKMFNRIKDNMGDLISDEELKVLVDTAMRKAFFEERRTPATSSWHSDKVEPPFLVSVIDELMKPMVKERIVVFMEEHKEEVLEQIDKTIAKGFFELVQQHQMQQIHGPLMDFHAKLAAKGVFI